MDVIRNSAVVALNQANVRALEANLQATGDRFEVGAVTRPDVAQSESRPALARSDLQHAEDTLIPARANYTPLVGEAAAKREPPPAPPGLPAPPARPGPGAL